MAYYNIRILFEHTRPNGTMKEVMKLLFRASVSKDFSWSSDFLKERFFFQMVSTFKKPQWR